MIEIKENISLADYSTMRLGGVARYLATPTSVDEVVELVEWAEDKVLRIVVLGAGANTIFNDGILDALVLVMGIKGLTFSEQKRGIIVEAGAGEDWDNVVSECVKRGLCGIESLSMVPGSVGAAPVQNIGAYGQQIASTLREIEVYDTLIKKRMMFTAEECKFRYRASRFNREDKGRFIVLRVKLYLETTLQGTPLYKDVKQYFKEQNIDAPSVADIRSAVIAIRTRKLPDPKLVSNCGSFFYNPIIEQERFHSLQEKFPELKAHKTDDGNLKLYAGQLIEIAGFKGVIDEETGMGTWPHQALVVVNYQAHSTRDLLVYKKKIVASVQELFDVILTQEPELV